MCFPEPETVLLLLLLFWGVILFFCVFYTFNTLWLKKWLNSNCTCFRKRPRFSSQHLQGSS